MNIFYLSENTKECAEYHTNSHCIKMILEYNQILASAHRFLDGKLHEIEWQGKKKKFYLLDGESNVIVIKKESYELINEERKFVITERLTIENPLCYHHTHLHHPCVKWVRTSSENYLWLYSLLEELLKEYTFRYEKIHKSSCFMQFLSQVPKNIQIGEITERPKSMDDDLKKETVLESYHNYYKFGKTHLHSWKKREIPYFI